MSSETTAAAAGEVGELRFDPMAMLPFCGYNMADYFSHWLAIAREHPDELPRIFFVNWFRKDDDGKFLWPGFGENSRVLEWIFRRCDGEGETVETPIGLVPAEGDLDLAGLEISDEAMRELLTVDAEQVRAQLPQVEELLAQFGDGSRTRSAQQLEALDASAWAEHRRCCDNRVSAINCAGDGTARRPDSCCREARRRHGVTPDAARDPREHDASRRSRAIERDQVSPSVETAAASCCTCSARTWCSTSEPRDAGARSRPRREATSGSSSSRRASARARAVADLVRQQPRRRRRTGSVTRRAAAAEVALDVARSCWQLLVRAGVDFVVIGGLAGLAQGSSYPTFDLDIAYAREPANLERLVEVLRELDVHLTNAPADLPFQVDRRTLEDGANFTFDTKYGRFDILGHVPGVSSYDELRAEPTRPIEGVEVRVASIDHLIAMKRAAGRTKDKLMLEEYIVIADEQRRAQPE